MFKMHKITVLLLVASIYQPTRAQGICDLPDSGTAELSGSCNFNSGVCDYNFPSSLWDVHSESFGGLIYGKIRGDDSGEKQTFALFQSNDPKVNESLVVNSSIVSPVIYTSPVCLKFWFLMPNQNSRLDVFTVDQQDNTTTLVYEYVYKPASQWQEAKVLISPGSAYKLEFRSAKENNYGYVGIDHIQVLIALTTTATAPTTLSTTTLPTTTSETITTDTTTTEATTTEATTTEATTTEATTSEATTTEATTTESTTTEATTTEATTSTTFSTTTTTLPTTTTTTEATTTEATTTEATTTEAITTEATTAEATTRCTCNCPTVPTICAGDPLPTTTPVSPPTLCDLPADQRSVLGQYSCNFDHGLCGYNISTYPHLWEYASYRYGDPDVGEIVGDHSLEAVGGYLLFSTYNDHVQNGTEHVFHSPALLPFTQYCVTFWYNMPNNGSQLDVNAVFDNGTRLLLWERTNSETNGWVREQIAVRENSGFRLQFRAWKDNVLSFLAVDDIQVSIEKPLFPRALRFRRQSQHVLDTADDSPGCTCTCPAYHVIDCNTFTPIPPYARSCGDLTGAVLEGDGSCNFDNGNPCRYMLPVYPHLWELVRFRYGNGTIGVINGDTSKEGGGMYAAFTTDSYRVPLGEGGDLTSASVMHAGKLCLSFQYNMPTDASAISVYRETGSQRTLLWSKSNVISSGWQQATIFLSGNETFQIVFSSKKTSLEGYFGIDDIRLYSNVSFNG